MRLLFWNPFGTKRIESEPSEPLKIMPGVGQPAACGLAGCLWPFGCLWPVGCLCDIVGFL